MFKKITITLLMLSMPLTSLKAENVIENNESKLTEVAVEIETDLRFVEVANGEFIVFPTEADYQAFMSAQTKQSGKQARSIPSYGKNTLLSSSTTYQKFLGYHPDMPNWRKASSHSITNSRTFTFSSSVSYDGVNVGFSASFYGGVSSTLPANASRYSRLGMAADVKVSKYRYDEYESGTNLHLKSYVFYSVTVLDSYVNVYYQ